MLISSALVTILIWAIPAVSKKEAGPVTCGSVIKLQHKETGFNLHSHGIAWGSGSGQQSVTANSAKNDKGSLWVIKEAVGSDVCEAGTPIKCGTGVRFEHAETRKNLHSHLFKAPLTSNQEVSGFGDSGTGDTGDNWTIMCETSDEYWMRYKPVVLRHVDTGKYLASTNRAVFNQQNCGGNCPIMSQQEVSCAARKDVNARWNTDQGVYFPPNKGDFGATDEDDEDMDDEL